jgi:hypothetical protein
MVDWAMDGLADLHDFVIAGLGALAPILSVINNILAIALTVLSIASIFFPVLAPFALGLGVALLATTYLQKVGEDGGFVAALKNPAVWAAAAGVVLGGAGAVLARAAGPSLRTVQSMGSLRTMGFAMRPAGTYLSQGVTNTMRASNVLTGGTLAVEAINTFGNPEGNHLANLTSMGVVFNSPNSDPGINTDPSVDTIVDNFTATDEERGRGAFVDESQDAAYGQ